MGFLERPLREKETLDGGPGLGALAYGSCSMQGWRLRNEDAQCCRLNFNGNPGSALFAVFDGHGGPEVAQFSAANFPTHFANSDGFKAGDFAEALRTSFMAMDEAILTDWPNSLLQFTASPGGGGGDDGALPRAPSLNMTELPMDEDIDPFQLGGPGCAALACFIHEGQLHLANAGDCRAVLCRSGVAVQLSTDHTPKLKDEQERILKAGGCIREGRVNGCLSLSRGIGDFHFKQNFYLEAEHQIVTAEAEVCSRELTPEDEFLLLGCDGVWEKMTPQEAVDMVKDQLSDLAEDAQLGPEGVKYSSAPMRSPWGGLRLAYNSPPRKLSGVAGDLLDRLVAPNIYTSGGVGCDNMTCIIVDLSRHRALRHPCSFFASLYQAIAGA